MWRRSVEEGDVVTPGPAITGGTSSRGERVVDPDGAVAGETQGTDPPMLDCRGLTKRYGDRVVVDDVCFRIDRGETYGLLGPNGAGKTTAISMICGLLRSDAGRVTIDGRPIGSDDRMAKALIGYVPQDIALYPDLSARENLRFFGRLQGLRGRLLAGRVEEVIDLIGLVDRAGDRVDSFSGGMKRRCNIGVALLHRPELLVLDEPTVGVDPQSRHAILESIAVLGGQGLSVLYTTHYMEEAERLCDRIGIIDEGRLIAEGTAEDLVRQVHERSRIRVDASGDLESFVARCSQLEDVERVIDAPGRIELVVMNPGHALAPVIEAAAAAGVALTSVAVTEPDLETVFLDLTGRALRDTT
jgi:ABC-2 type transport system ATP-binding protein